jgi:hypothetical protein
VTADAELVQARCAELPSFLHALGEHVERYRSQGVVLDPLGTLSVGHQPWRAPLAYAFHLFPAAEPSWLSGFEERHHVTIPAAYREFLLSMNGCWAYSLALYGLTPSLQARVPRLDRKRVQPLDLGQANTGWKFEYRGGNSDFHFGGRDWSREEDVGYFLTREDLVARRRDGEITGRWPDLGSLLADELPRAEALMLAAVPKG